MCTIIRVKYNEILVKCMVKYTENPNHIQFLELRSHVASYIHTVPTNSKCPLEQYMYICIHMVSVAMVTEHF